MCKDAETIDLPREVIEGDSNPSDIVLPSAKILGNGNNSGKDLPDEHIRGK